jgi:phosphoribosylformylglycinamidine cyclo-ligase
MSEKYRQAGVDIEAGDRTARAIGPIAAATSIPGVVGGLGGFGGLFSLAEAGLLGGGEEDIVLVSATDGVGTKLELAAGLGRHDTIGIDCVAMCANDVVTTGARPLFFLDYVATGALDEGQILDVVSGVARGCALAGCALIGGETAEMPGFYDAGRYDIAGFCVGAARRSALFDRDGMRAGDVLVGIPSSGPHSNGYSLIRKIVADHEVDLGEVDPRFGAGRTAGEILLEPTRMYVGDVLKASEVGEVFAASHITGGGLLGNLPRVLPDGLGAAVDLSSWEPPRVFDALCGLGGVGASERHEVFNMGVGMVLVMRAGVDACLEEVEGAFVMGEVVEGSGVTLRT